MNALLQRRHKQLIIKCENYYGVYNYDKLMIPHCIVNM